MDKYFYYSNALTQVYECGALDYASLPNEDIDVSILGTLFNAKRDNDALAVCGKHFFWFTYRKNLTPICEVSDLTSDQGWGCMHRSGQMLLANVFARIVSENKLPFPSSNESISNKLQDILNLFVDTPRSVFSIHSITSAASSLVDKKPGEWLGPNAVCQTLKQIFEYSKRPVLQDLFLYVCRDGSLIINDILALYEDASKCNKKLLAMIPLRLGLSDVNPQYFPTLLSIMRFPQFSGFVGGKPNHASWFFGSLGDSELLCLDPHTTQPFSDPAKSDDCSSYHCPYITRIPILSLDPSLSLAFYCESIDSFTSLCSQLQSIFKDNPSAALFDVVQEMPPDISSSMADWPVSSSEDSSDSNFKVGADFEVI